MRCMLCNRRIENGEDVIVVSRAVYCGGIYDDLSVEEVEQIGVLHPECWEEVEAVIPGSEEQ